MRKFYSYIVAAILMAVSLNAWATDVTYTVSSKDAVTTTGTAPTNSSVTFSSNGNTAQQLTGGTGQTLTLSGYKGYKITKITLSMRSNSSKGEGTLCYSANNGSSYTYLVGSSGSGVKFNNSAWYGSWSTDYVNVMKSVNIECGESNVIIKIDATANSLYCQSYTLTYETNDDRTPTTITFDASGINNNMFDDNTDGGVIAATIKAGETTVAGSVSWSSTVTSVATIDVASGAITLVGVGTTTITASFEGNVDYKPSTGTYNVTVINVNPNKTTIWSEDFSGYAATAVPSGGMYSYSCEGTGTKVYDESLAGGSKPELLVGKSGGSYTATIPLGYCCYGDMTLTFRTNNTNIAVSSSTTGVSVTGDIVSGANTLTISNVTTNMASLEIVFSNDNDKNVRLDNIVLKSLVEVPVNGSNEMTSNVTIPYGATCNVSSTVIIPSNKTLTINGILNVTGTLTNNGTAANLVIEDGGQLYTESTGVNATLYKNITGYTNDNNGWNFIASPVNVNNLAPTAVTNMLSNTYDLYQLNNTSWENYKDNEGHTNAANGFSLRNGRGYLYANSSDVELSFAGEIKPFTTANDANQVPLTDGWNLVGNPYTFNVYSSKSYYTIQTENSKNVIKAASNAAIAPCTGIVVQSDGAGNVAFTTSPAVWATGNNGNIELTLAQTVTTRGNAATLDNAIVSFNEGSQLEKFYFGTQDANIYIPQGSEEYAIVSSEACGEMPVNFKAAKDGEYTLTVNAENVEMNYLHLIDNLTGADTDLLATPSYTFNARTTDYASRFRLVFGANDENGASTSSATFAYVSNGQVVVNGTGTLQVVDMLGRIVASQEVTTANCQLSTANYKTGVYVLRLVNNGDVKTQKMVIE